MRNEFRGFGMLSTSWGFFQRPEGDVKDLLELHSHQSSADFLVRDDRWCEYAAMREVRRARLHHRLKILKYVRQAVSRRVRWYYGSYMLPFWLAQWAKCKNVAAKEQVTQEAEIVKAESLEKETTQ